MTARQDAAEVLAAVLIAEGGTPGSSLHSWRCEHPDIYGPCGCVTETAQQQVDALAAADLLVTPEHDAQVAARAWDEGWRACADSARATSRGSATQTRNPYRQEVRHDG